MLKIHRNKWMASRRAFFVVKTLSKTRVEIEKIQVIHKNCKHAKKHRNRKRNIVARISTDYQNQITSKTPFTDYELSKYVRMNSLHHLSCGVRNKDSLH